jgi:hypothetical protein
MKVLNLLVSILFVALLTAPATFARKKRSKRVTTDQVVGVKPSLMRSSVIHIRLETIPDRVQMRVLDPSPGRNGVTYANFDSIRTGDPFGRVQALLGEGEQIRKYQQDGETYTLFEYRSNDGTGYVTIWLKGTTVETKDQIGLRPPLYPNSLLPDPEK